MLHHISLGVADLARSAAFYDATLSALGYVRGDKLAIKLRGADAAAPGPGFHLAFAAPSPEAVDRFHEAALRSGGRDDGPAGLRAHYGPNYYAAFVIDPDGHRIEAVINTAP
jgi:catechol 2,3-dioxygenase-like lactoylglutathione lyase family enzyme